MLKIIYLFILMIIATNYSWAAKNNYKMKLF